jgi:hypothetical protein
MDRKRWRWRNRRNDRRREGATHASHVRPGMVAPGLRAARTAQRNDPRQADFGDRFARIVGTMEAKESPTDAARLLGFTPLQRGFPRRPGQGSTQQFGQGLSLGKQDRADFGRPFGI